MSERPSLPIRHTILFCLHQHDRELDPQLQCRVKWGSSKFIVTLNTGYRIDREGWDAEAQLCRPRTQHGARRIPAATINQEIYRYTQAAEDAFAHFAAADIFPTVPAMRAELQSLLFRQSTVEARQDVLTAFDAFATEQAVKNSWSDGTITKMRVVRRHLAGWKSAIRWDDFSEEGLTSYVTYLREVKHHQNSTLKKQLGFLRWFLAWAEGKGYLSNSDYRRYRPKMKASGKPVIYLTWDELMAVWDAELTGLHAHVRDVFCFCCFTSLRYSDAVNLRWSNVGPKEISITTVKTADSLTIDLNKWSREILSRHVDECHADDRVFETMPNQIMNRYLHDICRDCGINAPVRFTWYRGSERHDETREKWELITSHCGRRTFIVNALSMGIQPSVVMMWTGHSDWSAMKPYIEITEESKAHAMAMFDVKK